MTSRTIYMPDGSPCPELMTRSEAVKFLRLDMTEVKSPEDTIDYYRNKGLLRAVQIGKCIRFHVDDLIDFIEAQKQEVRR